MQENLTHRRDDTRTIPEFIDDRMGFPVILVASAYEAKSGEDVGVVVPDIAGLEAAMAVARVMDDFRLSGKDLKFLRKAIGLKAVDLADFLNVTPETLSRWENGKEPISTNAERVMRMRICNTLRNKAVGVKADLNLILDMKFRPVRPAGDGMMVFRRMPVIIEDGDVQEIWVHQGSRTSNVQHMSRLRA